jgi:hypothetical protein
MVTLAALALAIALPLLVKFATNRTAAEENASLIAELTGGPIAVRRRGQRCIFSGWR